MKLILEIEDNKKALAHEVFKSMSFVKNIKVYPGRNEITNKAILKSIEDYEKKRIKPTKINLKQLKLLLSHA